MKKLRLEADEEELSRCPLKLPQGSSGPCVIIIIIVKDPLPEMDYLRFFVVRENKNK